jgi:hypothetical protein
MVEAVTPSSRLSASRSSPRSTRSTISVFGRDDHRPRSGRGRAFGWSAHGHLSCGASCPQLGVQVNRGAKESSRRAAQSGR